MTPLYDDAGAAESHQMPLLLTKVQIPAVSPSLVARPSLFARLDEGAQRKLTLLAAPAGFGKTTLLSAWLQRSELAAAWVSLDSADNDPERFWHYVIAALDGVAGGIGQAALQELRRRRPASHEPLLATLINALSATPQKTILVLDDYHLIHEAAIHEALAFLLEHMPPQLSLIIASRTVPPLPLPRLRARANLAEVRAEELRFTLDEATTLLHQQSVSHLDPDEIAALHARTEGWIAALQLASLALQDEGAGQAWSGNHPHLQSYLAQEVLHAQPAQVQEFLLQTSILTCLEATLCDAVTERADSRNTLEWLEQNSLFLSRADEERRWYRYHALFADFLRAHLQQTEPAQVPGLHHRASLWFEQHGQLAEALGHALAASDWERAGRLLQPLVMSKVQSGELPPEVLDPTRPFGARQIDAVLEALGVPASARRSKRMLPSDKLLTEREQEVLRLLARKQSYHAIAGELTITKNTVKWHVKSAYRKLGVRRRIEAIERARELQLLA